MNYQPLHLKYRPTKLSELVGQDSIKKVLTNAITSGKISHAYLFTGSRGTGKTSSARILAKSLNCQSGDAPTIDPCGICESCKAIALGSSLDCIEIDAASNNGVDNIRELIEKAQFVPSGRYKVVLLDEVHMITNAGFNALLKTLEEPPKHVIFILATTDPQRVLTTIISRCQRFDFRRIGIDSITNHLLDIAQKESIEIEPDAAKLIATLSNGGMRDAQSMLDKLSLYGAITTDLIYEVSGAVSLSSILALAQIINGGDSAKIIGKLDEILDNGKEPITIIQNLAKLYRDMMLYKSSGIKPDGMAEEFENIAGLMTDAELQANLTSLRQSEYQLKSSTQQRLWLDAIILGLVKIKSNTEVVEKVVNPTPIKPIEERIRISTLSAKNGDINCFDIDNGGLYDGFTNGDYKKWSHIQYTKGNLAFKQGFDEIINKLLQGSDITLCGDLGHGNDLKKMLIYYYNAGAKQ